MTLEEFIQQSKESKPKMGNTNYDEDEFENEFDVMNPNPYRHEFNPVNKNTISVKITSEQYKELDHIHKTLALHQVTLNKLRENISHERKTTVEKLGASNTMMQQQISGITANFSEALSGLREELLALVSTKNTEAHTAITQLDVSLTHKLNMIDSTLAQVLANVKESRPGSSTVRLFSNDLFANPDLLRQATSQAVKDGFDGEDISDGEYDICFESDTGYPYITTMDEMMTAIKRREENNGK